MRTKLILLTLVLSLTVLFGLTYAQPFPGDDMAQMRHGKGMHQPMGLPDLTPDQLKAIQKLQLEQQKEMLPLRTKLDAEELELKSMILEGSAQSKLDQKIEEIGAIKTNMMKNHVKHHLAMRNLLTDKQKVIFDARRMMFGKGLHHGPGPDHCRCKPMQD